MLLGSWFIGRIELGKGGRLLGGSPPPRRVLFAPEPQERSKGHAGPGHETRPDTKQSWPVNLQCSLDERGTDCPPECSMASCWPSWAQRTSHTQTATHVPHRSPIPSSGVWTYWIACPRVLSVPDIHVEHRVSTSTPVNQRLHTQGFSFVALPPALATVICNVRYAGTPGAEARRTRARANGVPVCGDAEGALIP